MSYIHSGVSGIWQPREVISSVLKRAEKTCAGLESNRLDEFLASCRWTRQCPSRQTEMISNFPPQPGQRPMSISNNRFHKHAQLMCTEANNCGWSSFTLDGLLLVFCPPRIISACNLAWVASTPWKRMRLSLGLGSKATRHCMNSNG